MSIVRGSCLCGAVAFEITSSPLLVVHCHCSRCRKVRGTGHATNMALPLDAVRIVRGEEEITNWKKPDASYFGHAFCRVCGSSVPRFDTDRKWAIVPMGSLDDDPGVKPQAHIFVGSKAPWDEITDDLPQNERGLAAK